MEYQKPVISDEEGAALKEEFEGIFKELIVPAFTGADMLLTWIENSDFFVCPASTQYHLACKYGLLKHSLNVYKRLLKSIQIEYGDKYEEELGVDKSELALIGLCHDLCKVNTYIVETRNVKNKFGEWVKEPYYKYSPDFEYGHGEKSVMIIQNFIHGLSLNVCLGIRYHMGAAGDSTSPLKDSNALKAMEEFNVVYWTHFADMAATYLDERREPKEE